MGDGVAILIALGAVAVVLFVTKNQEAKTAKMVTNISTAKSHQGLTGGDVAGAAATAVATYYGGPAAGAATAKATGVRL